MDEFNAKIRAYLNVINKRIDEIDHNNDGLIDFVIGEVTERIMLFLNSD